MPVIGALAARIATMGLSDRAARMLAWAAAILAAALLAWAGWSLLKSGIIATHDARQEAGRAKAQLDRQGAADQDEAPRRTADQADQDRLEQEVANAIHAHTEAAGRPVGPATGAALDGLRRQGERPVEQR